MKKIFFNAQIDKIIIDESLIIGFSWVNDSKDLSITVDWCGQEGLKDEFDFNNIITNLYFEFVTEAEFNFKFSELTMGALEITSFNFTPKDKIWLIEFSFDFYPVGYIRFYCNDFKFVIEPKNSKNILSDSKN